MARGVPGSGPMASGGLPAGVAFVDIIPNMRQFASRLTAGMTGARAAAVSGGIVVGAGILVGVGKMLKGGLQEAVQEQVALAGLKNAIQNAIDAGKDVGTTVPGVVKVADELQRVAGIADDAALSAASWLATFHNLLPDQATFDRALRGVADLAAQQAIARGGTIDLGTAQNLLAKALQDPVKGITALSRAGVTFTQAQKDQIKAMVESGDMAGAQKLIFKELEDQVGGAAKAYGETVPGKAARASKAFGEIQQSLAMGLLPVLEMLAGKLQVVAEWLVKHPALVKVLVIAVTALAAALIVASIATTILTIAASPILLVILGIVAAIVLWVAVFAVLWKKSETFQKIVTAAFNAVKTVVAAVVNFVRTHWKLLFPALALIVGVIKIVVQHFNSIKAVVAAVVGFAKSAFNAVPGAIGAVFAKVKGAVERPINAVKDFLKGLVSWARGVAGDVGRAFVSGIVNGLGGLFQAVYNKLKGALSDAIDKLKGVFGIGSPSKLLAKEVGRPLGEGIISGLVEALKGLGNALIIGLKGALEKAQGKLGPLLNTFQSVAQSAYQAITSGSDMPTPEEIEKMVKELAFGASLDAIVQQLSKGVSSATAAELINQFLDKFDIRGTPFEQVLTSLAGDLAAGSESVQAAAAYEAALAEWEKRKEAWDAWHKKVTDKDSPGGRNITAGEKRKQPPKPGTKPTAPVGMWQGGQLAPWQWGLVGERGPELVYGGRSGMTVFPSGTAPGRGVTVENMNIRTDVDIDLVAAALYRKALASG